MKIVVIFGGTGLIGSKVVAGLTEQGNEGRARLAAPRHQHHHGRRAHGGARWGFGRRGACQLPELRVRHGARFLRDVDPGGRRGERGGGPPRRAVGGRTRALSEGGDLARDDRRLLPGEVGAGSTCPYGTFLQHHWGDFPLAVSFKDHLALRVNVHQNRIAILEFAAQQTIR